MPLESLQLSVVLDASPEEIFNAWLDGRQHGLFTGSPAEVEPVEGGRHTAWDGYITGKNLVLEPGRRIVQSWRTTEFPPEAGDSTLELLLTAVEGGTELRLAHTEIPEGQGHDYEQGWVEYYFEPMKKHFAGRARAPLAVAPPAAPAPEQKAAPKKPAAKKAAPKKKAAAKKAAPKKAARRPAKKAKAARKPAKAKKAAKKPAKKAARGKKR